VAGRHHHPGGGVQVGDGEGQHRRGHRVGHEVGPDAGAGEDRRRVGGEHIAVVTGVEADHDAAPGGGRVRVEQPAGQAGRRPPHDDPVHAHRPGAELGAQAGRAELELAPEAIG
jgi:hypothetical protein